MQKLFFIYLKIVAGVTRRTVLSYGCSSDTTVVTNTVGAYKTRMNARMD